jgi:hypothetical protein
MQGHKALSAMRNIIGKDAMNTLKEDFRGMLFKMIMIQYEAIIFH